jgi:hypothetical protein
MKNQNDEVFRHSSMGFQNVGSSFLDDYNESQEKPSERQKLKESGLMSFDVKEKFEDLPLQYSELGKIKSKQLNPFILVEDKGDKKD